MLDVRHWWHVATRFRPWREEFWLGLAHDTVDDGLLSPAVLGWWPRLDAITRREGEPYFDYIERAGQHPVAAAVKLADLCHNIHRNGGPPGNLAQRYSKAAQRLRKAARISEDEVPG